MTSATRDLGGKSIWDRAGMTASALCVAHCLASPLVATALPVIAATEGATHRVLALAVLSFGLLAFVPGFRKHRRGQVLSLGFAGVAFIWTPVLLPESLALGSIETVVTVFGGFAMVGAHLLNLYFCRTCRVCTECPQ